MQRAEREASDFNAQYAIGTPVLYHGIIGDPATAVATKTRTEAWALSCGEAVVSVEGKSGGVSLEAIKIVEPAL